MHKIVFEKKIVDLRECLQKILHKKIDPKHYGA